LNQKLEKTTSRNGIGRMDLHRKGSAFSVTSFISDTRERLSIVPMSRANSSIRLLSRANSSLTSALESKSSSTWRVLVRAISFKSKLRSAANLSTEAGVGGAEDGDGYGGAERETPGPMRFAGKASSSNPASSLACGHTQSERRPGVFFSWRNKSSEAGKRLRRLFAWTRINVSYFFRMWNFLGLMAYSLVLASFACFVLTWLRCARAVATGKDGAGAGSSSGGGGMDSGDDVCAVELVKLRALSALAIPILYLYSLYYVRCVDTFAFYVRMLKEIISDFMPFLLIFIWFLLSVTTGFWSLKCSSDPVAHGDAPAAFASLLQAVSLIPFEIQLPDELGACFEHRGIISHVATVLLWYLIFVLPLLSLNALIAIMGSTYHKVANRHRQQQYKEWAQIIGDVVQQWEETKRTEWERQFYWIHILTPRKYAASSSAAISLGDHVSRGNALAHLPPATPSSSSLNAHALDTSSESTAMRRQTQEQEHQRRMIDQLGRLHLTLAGVTRILADVLEPQSLNASPLSTFNDSPSASAYPQQPNLEAKAPRLFRSVAARAHPETEQGAGGEQPQEVTLKEKVGEAEEEELIADLMD
jgi:hypothetical protein